MKGVIKLGYRKIIDPASEEAWDKAVLNATYKEFLMQAQQFDQLKKYDTFQDMLLNIPKADRMHYLVSTAALGYLKHLGDLFPDATNTFDQPCVPFKNFRFEVIQSSVFDKAKHQVAIYFYSEPVLWVNTISTNQLVIARAEFEDAWKNGEEIETETLTLNPNLGIISYRKI